MSCLFVSNDLCTFYLHTRDFLSVLVFHLEFLIDVSRCDWLGALSWNIVMFPRVSASLFDISDHTQRLQSAMTLSSCHCQCQKATTLSSRHCQYGNMTSISFGYYNPKQMQYLVTCHPQCCVNSSARRNALLREQSVSMTMLYWKWINQNLLIFSREAAVNLFTILGWNRRYR